MSKLISLYSLIIVILSSVIPAKPLNSYIKNSSVYNEQSQSAYITYCRLNEKERKIYEELKKASVTLYTLQKDQNPEEAIKSEDFVTAGSGTVLFDKKISGVEYEMCILTAAHLFTDLVYPETIDEINKNFDIYLYKQNQNENGELEIRIIKKVELKLFYKDRDMAVLTLAEEKSENQNIMDIFRNNLKFAKEAPQVGDRIIGVSSFYAFFHHSYTEGYVSNIGIKMDNQTFDQVIFALTPGSSGSAIVNEDGEILGIVVMGLVRGTNIGFVVPSRDIVKKYNIEETKKRLRIRNKNKIGSIKI